jgi:hypothetical protein
MPKWDSSRREYLAAIGTVGLGGVAGCSGGEDGGDGETDVPSESEPNDEETSESGDGTSETDGTEDTTEGTETPGYGDLSGFPMFQYDPANTGHVTDESGPTSSVTEQWTFETDASVRSSPVVVDGTVYVGNGAY